MKAGQAESLKQLLAAMGRDPAANQVIPFGEFSQVHFARFVVLDAATDLGGKAIRASLLLIAELDAPVDRCSGDGVRRAATRAGR